MRPRSVPIVIMRDDGGEIGIEWGARTLAVDPGVEHIEIIVCENEIRAIARSDAAKLAFFGGRRFVPIASGVAGLALAAAFGLGWPVLEHGMDAMSRSVLGAGDLGLFAYGVLNRVLIVTGLHHILNNLAWFLIGDFNGVTGDLKRFFAGDPAAGRFMAGFFPVMMFGLPAACLAMYHAARVERRPALAGLFGSMALTSFLIGVTEPVEFTLVFLAPLLYALHSLLTGVAFVIMSALDVRLGFSFSAGVFDFVLNLDRASNPWLLLPVGLVYFALYYGVFRFFIRYFDLKTPGREMDDALTEQPAEAVAGDRASAFIRALGGRANLLTVDACTTRLRLEVADQNAVNAESLKRLGARGVVRPSANALQVILGPIADVVAGEIRSALRTTATGESALLAALGGRANVRSVEQSSTRLRVCVADPALIDDAAIRASGGRGIARPAAGIVHVIIGPESAPLFQRLQGLLQGA